MAALITDIMESVEKSDTELNAIIQDHMNSEFYIDSATTVAQWRIDKFAELREALYRTRDHDHIDALGKVNDPDADPDVIAEGQAALEKYYTWRKRSVKERFPKSG